MYCIEVCENNKTGTRSPGIFSFVTAVMMSAARLAVVSAAVFAAASVFMFMMRTLDIRVVVELSRKQGFDRFIGAALDSAV